MNKKMIKELLKAHCTIENGRLIFKPVDIDAASLELEQALQQTPCKTLLSLTQEQLNEVQQILENGIYQGANEDFHIGSVSIMEAFSKYREFQRQ